MKSKRISIRDVAKYANVSITTVSRVINDKGYPVSDKVRKRVWNAVKVLNYSPNIAAQSLRLSFSNLIGLIVRDVSDSYFSEIARGVTERGISLGYLAFVCNTGRNLSNELIYHELLWQHRVRGIILAGGGFNTPDYLSLIKKQLGRARENGLRMVALSPQGINMPLVSVNYPLISERATEFLISKGHRRIAFITGNRVVFTSQDHLKGYKRALDEAGIPFDERLVLFKDFTEKSGFEGINEILSSGAKVTAIFAGSDTIAIGVISGLNAVGLKVPEDVSVIGVGDILQAKYVRPSLTTFRVPRYKMGFKAAEIIANDREFDINTKIIFDAELVERESVKSI